MDFFEPCHVLAGTAKIRLPLLFVLIACAHVSASASHKRGRFHMNTGRPSSRFFLFIFSEGLRDTTTLSRHYPLLKTNTEGNFRSTTIKVPHTYLCLKTQPFLEHPANERLPLSIRKLVHKKNLPSDLFTRPQSIFKLRRPHHQDLTSRTPSSSVFHTLIPTSARSDPRFGPRLAAKSIPRRTCAHYNLVYAVL